MKKMFLSKKILVIGADGMIGRELFDSLRGVGAKVAGTSVKFGKNKELLYLDFYDNKSVAGFVWKNYGIIVNCAGSVNYEASMEASKNNIFINVLAPLDILSRLNKGQTYYHCSTQMVNLPQSEQNSYSLSKMFFENFVNLMNGIKANVVIMRLPGIYSDERQSGILSLIKNNYKTRKPLRIDWTAALWHAMYLPRTVEIISALIKNNCSEKLVTIGYPTSTTIEKVLSAAKKSFGYDLAVKLKKRKTLVYAQDVKIQNKYINIKVSDFEKDLLTYFKK